MPLFIRIKTKRDENTANNSHTFNFYVSPFLWKNPLTINLLRMFRVRNFYLLVPFIIHFGMKCIMQIFSFIYFIYFLVDIIYEFYGLVSFGIRIIWLCNIFYLKKSKCLNNEKKSSLKKVYSAKWVAMTHQIFEIMFNVGSISYTCLNCLSVSMCGKWLLKKKKNSFKWTTHLSKEINYEYFNTWSLFEA